MFDSNVDVVFCACHYNHPSNTPENSQFSKCQFVEINYTLLLLLYEYGKSKCQNPQIHW